MRDLCYSSSRNSWVSCGDDKKVIVWADETWQATTCRRTALGDSAATSESLGRNVRPPGPKVSYAVYPSFRI